MGLPHDNWAQYYDFVYQQTFAYIYTQLCEDTEDVCDQLVEHSPARGSEASILDVGAGTGRVTIPLLQQGHYVTAVEPSVSMRNELYRKAEVNNLTQNLTIEQELIQCIILPENSFDIALCVFTVIAYIIKESDLQRAIENIASSLKKDGLFLLDIPQSIIFRSGSIEQPTLQRQITITAENGANNLYSYSENCRGSMEGQPFEYSDSFLIRQWPDERVLNICRENGLVQSELENEILKGKFSATGAKYYLRKK